jgi:hypothetical protein
MIIKTSSPDPKDSNSPKTEVQMNSIKLSSCSSLNSPNPFTVPCDDSVILNLDKDTVGCVKILSREAVWDGTGCSRAAAYSSVIKNSMRSDGSKRKAGVLTFGMNFKP